MTPARHYAVDRIEGPVAVLVGDDGVEIQVLRRLLPRGVKEGTVLRVEGDWNTAVVDDAEHARRMREAEDVLRRLKARDPGGDVSL
jgi:hypothetical protein